MDPESSDIVETVEEKANRLAFEKVFGKLSFQFVEKAEISAASEEEDENEDEDEEEEDEDEDEDEDEEEDKDSVESDQEWDVDSFEGCEYNSDPEDSEDWRRYLRQISKSEAFDVPLDCLPREPGRLCCGFFPLELDDYFSPPDLTGRQYMENMLKVVIAKYNETKKKNLVLDHIVRAVVIMGGMVKAYITFMAKETPDGELVEYQGKAEWKVWQRNFHPLLCRPASEQRQLP